MKVVMTRYDGSETHESIADYVRHRLEEETQRGGAIETLEARVDALSGCLGRLVGLLAESGYLSADQLFNALPADFNVKSVRIER